MNRFEMKLTPRQLRIFPRIQRRYNVSVKFLKYNMHNIEKFLLYALYPRLVIKRVAIRKGRSQRVVLDYYHLRRVLFDLARRKMIKTRKRNIQQWSKRMVCYLKNTYGIQEFVEETPLHGQDENMKETVKSETSSMPPEEVSKQLKEQLQLLRSGKRVVPLIDGSSSKTATESCDEIRQDDVEDKVKSVNLNENDSYNNENEMKVDSFYEHELQERIKLDEVNPATSSETVQTASDKTDIQANQEATPKKQAISGRDSHNFLDSLKNNSIKVKIDEDETEQDESTCEVKQDIPNLNCAIGEHNKMHVDKPKSASNFLDMLMNKMNVRNLNNEVVETEVDAVSATEHNIVLQNADRYDIDDTLYLPNTSSKKETQDHDNFTDSSDEFLGFEESEYIPGMMRTPLVPQCSKFKGENSAFVSESLNEYLRQNLLESAVATSSDSKSELDIISSRKHCQSTVLDGLVTLSCKPPYMDMPLVPESLQKLRTVAERRLYLQKFSKNHKLAIINNEATIYRELQRKIRHKHKAKSASQQLLQAPNSQIPFTRRGWQAASFVTTDFNKYYYQMLDVDDGSDIVKLSGVRGNNEERNKKPYISKLSRPIQQQVLCTEEACSDWLQWRDFKSVKSVSNNKKKLNKTPLPAVFKPCPLSYKPFQKPLDDETAALLLTGGSMAVVCMPSVEIEVFPELGKPLHEIAKRYLQYILPHHDITREWAEFSVSTLMQSSRASHTLKDTERAVAASVAKTNSGRRKSFTFAIPYLNDRNHILVRRVIDRSEKLDQSFEQAQNSESSISGEDLSFRANLDKSNQVLVECADIVGDMINSVAISCSENSFIKEDPDSLYATNLKTVDKTAQSDVMLKMTQSSATAVTKTECTVAVQKSGSTATCNAQNKKQNRLLLELRRLNATIIDAAAKAEKEYKPCGNEYCTLGCVCTSLADDYPLRQHCGKSKCVIECVCKGTSQSRIMRLETDGRSITTEDAFMLRRKATARLARMEKEFTSTIVLTENETLLINESQYDKKRRCTKAPKRYEDFADNDDDYHIRNSPNKKSAATASASSSAVVAIEANESLSSNTGFSEITTELREPIYVRDVLLDQLKHCTVSLVPFEDTKNMAVWCMVHELYKCFCGGRATEGKAIIIEKEEVNTTTAANKFGMGEEEYAVKAHYSFDKTELDYKDFALKLGKQTPTPDTDRKIVEQHTTLESETRSRELDSFQLQVYDADNSNDVQPLKRKNRHNLKPADNIRRGRPSELDIKQDYYQAQLDDCRRAVPIPRKSFLRVNRKRLTEVKEYIDQKESAKTRLLLNEHILRSVYYHKHELEKQRKEEERALTSKKRVSDTKHNGETLEKKRKRDNNSELENEKPPVIPNNQDIVDLLDDEPKQSFATSSSSVLKKSPHGNKIQELEQDQPDTNCSKESGRNNNSDKNIYQIHAVEKETIAIRDHSTESQQMPKISGCFSLIENIQSSSTLTKTLITKKRSEALVTSLIGDVTAAATAVGSQVAEGASSSFGLDADSSSTLSENCKEFYNNVIKHMNNLVSKKMQDIDMALKRESKVIPAPNDEILCIIKWNNFLDAFKEGFVFIWEVKLSDRNFFAATISNMMPMIFGAMGVVNITALNMKKLPLMGRMLLEGFRNETTDNLAIVMQGRAKYWLVKGFLRPDVKSACARPTPQTHPALTRKINILSNLLFKQRIRDYQRKIQQQKQQHQEQYQNEPQKQSTETITKAQINTSIPREDVPTLNKEELSTQVQSQVQIKNKKQKECQQYVPPTIASSQSKPLVPAATNKSWKSINTKTSSTLSSRSNALLLRNITSSQDSEYSNMKTNIEFRKIVKEDIDEIHQPEIHTEDHRWLVLDLYNDFSHIFVPDFRDLVSLDRIHKVMLFSRQKQKIVKLQFFQNAPFDAFVTPTSIRKIYFGPLKLNMRPPLLILLQSVDGQMTLRENYQREHNIQTKTGEVTTAFWILQINGQIHFEIDCDIATNTDNELPTEVTIATSDNKFIGSSPNMLPVKMQPQEEQLCVASDNNVNDDYDDDDDCMIIEDLEVQCAEKDYSSQFNSSLQSSLEFNSAALQSSEIQGVQPLVKQKPDNMFSFPVVLPQNSPSSQLPAFTPLLNLLPKAVITKVTNAPSEAPYGSTIYISNLSNGSGSSMLDAKSSSLSTNPRNASKPTLITSEVKVNAAMSKPSATIAPIRFEIPLDQLQNLKTLPENYTKAPKFLSTKNKVVKRTLVEDTFGEVGDSTIASKRIYLSNDNGQRDSLCNLQVMELTATNGSIVTPSNSLSLIAGATAVSTIGSTTITKLKDVLVETDATVQKARTSVGVDITKIAGASTKPTIFNVNFNDNPEESAPTIVLKPTSANECSSAATTNTYALKTKGTAGTIARSTISIGATMKNTVCGNSSILQDTLKPLKTVRTSNAMLNTSDSVTNTSALNPTISTNAISPMMLGSSKNFRAVTSTPLNFSNSSKVSEVQQAIKMKISPKVNVKSVATLGYHLEPKANPSSSSVILPVLSGKNKVKIAKVVPPVSSSAPLTAISRVTTATSGSAPTVTSCISAGYSGGRMTTSLSTPHKKPIITVRSGVSIGTASQQSPLLKVNSVKPQVKPCAEQQRQRTIPIARGSTALAIANETELVRKPKYLSPLSAEAASSRFSSSPGTTPTSSEDIQYGFLYPNDTALPKYIVKRMRDVFLVKVPTVGIVQMRSFERVSNYLNQHLLKKDENLARKLPAIWKFVPHDQLRKDAKQSDKIHDEIRKYITVATTSKMINSHASHTSKQSKVQALAAITSTATTKPMKTASKAVINATAAASTNVHNDTILIDD